MFTTLLGRITTSNRERMAHVGRRLGVGTQPFTVAGATDVDDMISAMLDLSGPAVSLPDIEVPMSYDEVEEWASIDLLGTWWLERMADGYQPIVERLTWFWHDHFATSQSKVENGYLMWRQHETIRSHATGNFGELLRAVAVDAAMLVYLDGELNSVEALNENFGREIMELFTTGPGHYTQADVIEASRAASGWMINWASWDEYGVFEEPDVEPWRSYVLDEYRDTGHKTLHGRSGDLDMDDLVDILLEHHATAEFVATKMFRELVGVDPDQRTATRLGDVFRADYDIMALVEAIVGQPAFLEPANFRSKIRTPVERLVSLYQGFDRHPELEDISVWWWLEGLDFLPFHPPNPAGFPKQRALLSPGMLVDSFLLLEVVGEEPVDMPAAEILERLALYDLSTDTRAVIDRHGADAGFVLGLAYGSPEFAQI